jgi:hypothetical protein
MNHQLQQSGVTDATEGWEVTPPASPGSGVDIAGAWDLAIS